MIYNLFKLPAQLALSIYCKKFKIDRSVFKSEGPLLLACNHPNSFLDAILLSAWFKQPIHSLARGDAFKKGFTGWYLRVMHMLPVYRTSEGVQNLENNYDTFDACKEVFRNNGIVLIFSEGLCTNEWHLRSLKKGTARLAISSWNDGIPLKVLPVGFNYHSFRSTDKIIHINFGEIFSGLDPSDEEKSEGKKLLEFNEILKTQLEKLVYEIPTGDAVTARKVFGTYETTGKKIFLFIPAMIGFITSYPYYKPVHNFVEKKARGTGHRDSILLGILFFGYPIYVLLISVIVGIFLGWWWWLAVFILIPLSAWSMVQWKNTGKYGEA